MKYTFSLCAGGKSSREAEELGLHFMGAYVTVNNGAGWMYEAPEGTEQVESDNPSSTTGYDTQATFIYKLPDGRRFRGGGGGPANFDSLGQIIE